jgi:para-nitrobenzyl esterase
MAETEKAIAETTSGKIEGVFRKGLYVFRGVPFAAPPVGRKRWLPPEPLKPWAGVRPAVTFGPTCPQVPMEISLLNPPEEQPQNEDCLYLNIWTPGLDNAKRPVMVWIHGGGFTTGSGSWLIYNGRRLATRGDVVVVTINYRLNVFGFINLKEVTRGRIPATGNEGLLDQVFALQWVRDNISRFGGDPGNVTIFGESAGAMSVGALLAMPGAKGLFHRAILQSGAAHHVNSMERAAKVANMFLDILSVKPDGAEKLWSLTTEQLLQAYKELGVRARDPKLGLGDLPLRPVVDGSVLPEMPLRAVANGSADNVPIMVGTNLDEWKLFALMDRGLAQLDEARLLRRCQRLIPVGDVSGLVEAYRKARSRRGQPATPADLFIAIQSDRLFRIPAIRLTEAHRDRKQPSYMYLFDWVSPLRQGALGSCHALELGFVFGTLDDNFTGSGEEARNLSNTMQDAWTAFARSGAPGCQSLGNWAVYSERRETMVLGKRCGLVETPYDEERQAWEKVPDTVLSSF